ncbi:hypothetical protein E2C01_088021 [Portunus trituberculatus]|uniref:Uncharacterized protein n=1 Tax=Portunus trituberculatus TaxID=210409 RepID=A0A5B7JIS3_PORTR|nr:hypothetical protein [Portunus trituberculatus]
MEGVSGEQGDWGVQGVERGEWGEGSGERLSEDEGFSASALNVKSFIQTQTFLHYEMPPTLPTHPHPLHPYRPSPPAPAIPRVRARV